MAPNATKSPKRPQSEPSPSFDRTFSLIMKIDAAHIVLDMRRGGEDGLPAREAIGGGDMLDAVIDLEAQWFEEGFEAGQEEGRKRSIADGKTTGYPKGYEIGCELGFYEACCLVWCERRKCASTEGENKERQDRIEKAVLGILEMIEEVPRKNSPDVDFADSLQRIRAKFKAASTLMGVRLPFSLKPSIDEGLNF